jgi:hypothetical protein
MGEPSTTVDVDNLSFAVRAQKFRIAASIMKRTSIPLTRSTPRVWCISSAALRRKSSPASSIPTSLRRVCCCRTAELGTGRGSRGHLRLSQRGQSALSPLEHAEHIRGGRHNGDRILRSGLLRSGRGRRASRPRPAARRRASHRRQIEGREFGSSGAGRLRSAFSEVGAGQSPRMGLDEDSRVHTAGDAHVIRNFAAPIEVPVRYRIDDVSGATPDLAELSAKGRAGSRDP